MTKKFKHIAVIPARAGSVGFPKKNQIFFDNTAEFLKDLLWLDEVIVSSNDKIVLDKAKKRKFRVYERSEVLSDSNVSIKSVFKDLTNSLKIFDDVILWLFYLPILYKNFSDFEKAKIIIEKSETNSLCTFIAAKTHPLNTWQYDQKNKKISQYVKNDIYRRQDLSPAWMHYHYVCCFKAKELENLNSELLNSDTYPVFLSDNYAKNLVEIDTPKDFEKWKELNGKS
jgi:CMP-N-acetylneuraminic acid synthetase